MGLGLQNAYGLENAQQGLRQRIIDQLNQQRQQQEMQLAERRMVMQETEQKAREQDRGELAKSLMEQRQATQQQGEDTRAANAFTMSPAGAQLPAKMAGRLQTLGYPVATTPGVSGPASAAGLPSDMGGGGAIALPSEATPTTFQRGQTQADIEKGKSNEIAAAKQAELERNNQANNDIKSHLNDITEKVRQGQMNNQEAMLAIRERLAAVTEQNASRKDNAAPKPLVLSQAGKSAKAAIEQAGPLTDQVMEMIKKEAPDIETNPDRYNTLMSKGTSLLQTAKYKLGFHDDSDPRQQLVSLLQPIQAGQYTRSSRSRQMLDLALKHMADPSQTLLTQYQRAKELKAIMPEMLEGIVRAEQPVDPSNPLGGSYFDKNKPAAGAQSGETPEQRSARLRKAAGL